MPTNLLLILEQQDQGSVKIDRAGWDSVDFLAYPAMMELFTFAARIRRASSTQALAILCTQQKLRSPGFWLGLLVLATCVPRKFRLYGRSGTLHDPLIVFCQYFLPAGPLLSLLQLLRLPLYLAQCIAANLPGRLSEGELTGFGRQSGVAGAIYWRIFEQKIRRYGLFGLAHDTYMGMPLGIHSWPASLLVFCRLGYPRFLVFTTLLIAFGAYGLFVSSGNATWALLIPLLLVSNYYLYSIFAGTWELLAWGFALVMLGALQAGMPAAAGLAGAALVLSHPGVAFLHFAFTSVLSILQPELFTDFVVAGVIATAATAWWVIAYLRCGVYLGRKHMLNAFWTVEYSWSPTNIYQALVFAAFAMACAYTTPDISQLVLLVPLLALFVNTKISWIFSDYTLRTFMLVAGMFELSQRPGVVPVLAFLPVVFTPAILIWSGAKEILGFSLNPVRLHRDVIEQIRRLFEPLSPGRVAVEYGRRPAHPGWRQLSGISFILSGSKVDLFTAAYTEIGDYNIFSKVVRHLNGEATREEFESACRHAGINYIVAVTEAFRRQLIERGYEELGRTEALHLSGYPEDPPVRFYAFKLPWPSQLVEPHVELTLGNNEMSFNAQAGQQYVIKLSAFRGWRATQAGIPLPVHDAKPGIALTAPADGPVSLHYRLRHYWSS